MTGAIRDGEYRGPVETCDDSQREGTIVQGRRPVHGREEDKGRRFKTGVRAPGAPRVGQRPLDLRDRFLAEEKRVGSAGKTHRDERVQVVFRESRSDPCGCGIGPIRQLNRWSIPDDWT